MREAAIVGCWVIGLTVLIIWGVSKLLGRSSDPAAAPAVLAEEPEAPAVCEPGDRCWVEENRSTAQLVCMNAVEHSARYQFKWTSGLMHPRFIGADQQGGLVRVRGDQVKMQNGFGAWENEIYTCLYDPKKKQLVDFKIAPGRF